MSCPSLDHPPDPPPGPRGRGRRGTSRRNYLGDAWVAQSPPLVQPGCAADRGPQSPHPGLRPAAMDDHEHGWSLSFAACGFLGCYHIGVTHCLQERAPQLLRNARMFFGSSAGALHCVTFLAGIPLGTSGPLPGSLPGGGVPGRGLRETPEGAGRLVDPSLHAGCAGYLPGASAVRSSSTAPFASEGSRLGGPPLGRGTPSAASPPSPSGARAQGSKGQDCDLREDSTGYMASPPTPGYSSDKRPTWRTGAAQEESTGTTKSLKVGLEVLTGAVPQIVALTSWLMWRPPRNIPRGCDLGREQILEGIGNIVSCARNRNIGIFHPSCNIFRLLQEFLQKWLPDNIHKLISGKVCISLTRVSDWQNVLVSDFQSKDEVVDALMCSSFIPCFFGIIPPTFRGVRYVDGGMSNSLPFFDSKTTITVSPFFGEFDICPRVKNVNSIFVDINQLTVYLCSENFNLIRHALFSVDMKPNSKKCGLKDQGGCGGSVHPCMCSPWRQGCATAATPSCSEFLVSSQVLGEICLRGYLDAVRFLEEKGMYGLGSRPALSSAFCAKQVAVCRDTAGTHSCGPPPGVRPAVEISWDAACSAVPVTIDQLGRSLQHSACYYRSAGMQAQPAARCLLLQIRCPPPLSTSQVHTWLWNPHSACVRDGARSPPHVSMASEPSPLSPSDDRLPCPSSPAARPDGLSSVPFVGICDRLHPCPTLSSREPDVSAFPWETTSLEASEGEAARQRRPVGDELLDHLRLNLLPWDESILEILSPSLITALSTASKSQSGYMTKICDFMPVKVMSYLMLPFTLPVESAVFGVRRLVTWLPDIPDDVRWLQSLGSQLCSRVVTRLLPTSRYMVCVGPMGIPFL
ncbi:uncharacterized protein WM277_020345 [Molossus nigricans]